MKLFSRRRAPENVVTEAEQRPSECRRPCVESCCLFIGWTCFSWWLLLFSYALMPSSVSEVITGPARDPPWVKLKKEGLHAKHPVVFVPGIVTGGLELWEGQDCVDGLFRKRVWGGTFGEVYKRPLCWVKHMSLDNESGLDPPGIKVRPVTGLAAADYFGPGYFVWAVLVSHLAKIGFEEKMMHVAAYDWRLSFQNTEVRDQTLSRIKMNIEFMVSKNGGRKAVIIPHSMGGLYFLHFMKWVEAPAPIGGGGGPDWCAKHIKAVLNIGVPLLGVPKAVSGLFSEEAKDVAVARAIAPNILGIGHPMMHALQQLMSMTRTWDSIMSMIPRGGDAVWGGLDWSPEEGGCFPRRRRANDSENGGIESKQKRVYYGRLISFGIHNAEAEHSEIKRIEFRDAVKGQNAANGTCGDAWTEYEDMGFAGIRAVAGYKAYTVGDIVDLLSFVAPKMMARGSAHFSYGIAKDLDEEKYVLQPRYWSNPLETKLPDAPEMEIISLYGVGIPTERAYVYRQTPSLDGSGCIIPFQIDTSANEQDGDGEAAVCGSLLLDGVFMVDGDQTVPVLSAGYMNAKGWRGKTRFNPSAIKSYVREYEHEPPDNVLLKGNNGRSASHVDIMGNFDLIEDVMRIAAGATGEELGGDRIYSDIFQWAQRIRIDLEISQ